MYKVALGCTRVSGVGGFPLDAGMPYITDPLPPLCASLPAACPNAVEALLTIHNHLSACYGYCHGSQRLVLSGKKQLALHANVLKGPAWDRGVLLDPGRHTKSKMSCT